MFSVRELVQGLLSVVAPVLCAGCGAPLRPGGGAQDPVLAALAPVLCRRCLDSVRPIAGACRVCGRQRPPFAVSARCGRCRFEPRGGVRSTVAAYAYTGVGRDLLRRLKFHDRRDLARPLGRALAAQVERTLPDIVGACGVALVTAVPIHWSRRLVRGFNQAELLGRACARELGLPFDAALARRRRTRALFAVHRGDRAAELAGALRASEAVRDRWVLLVDDIRTSGSTLAECGRALLAAGAARVDAAVVGR